MELFSLNWLMGTLWLGFIGIGIWCFLFYDPDTGEYR
jgi:hypothetical protein